MSLSVDTRRLSTPRRRLSFVRRRVLAVLAIALVLAGTVSAAGAATIVLPRPGFPAPARGAGSGAVHFTILSSSPADPARDVSAPRSRGVRVQGPDGNTQHLVVGSGYALDFENYTRPPRITPGEREFVYEQIVYANQSGPGTLYVETAHQTYAKSSYGLNGYLNAIDPRRAKLLWRSPAQVANASNFVLLNDTVVTGYGYTAEPDYLYALDRATGKVKGRVLLPSAPLRISRHGTTLTVDTYDHRLVVRISGG
jgi:outer membrane protein assembly factor BamB